MALYSYTVNKLLFSLDSCILTLDSNMDAIKETHFNFPGQTGFYKGKVRDVYTINNEYLVIRGYVAGHAAREYAAGRRQICGVSVPDGLKENDKLPGPIITPTTKASVGHDEDISREDILANGIVSEDDYVQLEKYTHALYQRGTEISAKRGLILVDTKYEFGKADGKIYLIDEIHTPDSSRYFYSEGYEERQEKSEPQKQLSKEFVRKWLIENGFQGKDGQVVPEMTKEIVQSISERYIELYEKITGEGFVKPAEKDVLKRVETAINSALASL